jgi:tripartite ATP-independent transporter DctM subunit
MEWWLVLIIFFASLISLFLCGLPIAFSFLGLDIIGLYLILGAKGMTLLASSMCDSVASFTMSPLPLFIFLGEIFYESKVVNIAFDAIDKWVGGVRARLHLVTLLFATIFGAISGSAMAMTAVLGTSVLPEMARRGYDKKLSMGVILGGSVLDPLIPPSGMAVIIASLADVSIAKLLVSGFGPGLFYSAVFVIYVLVMVWIKPEAAPLYTYSSKFWEKMFSLIQLMPFGIIIFLVLGLMMMGIATPTESAAIGAIAAMILAACLRKINFKMMKNSLYSTAKTSGMVLIIIASSKAFSQILAMSGGTENLVNITTRFETSPMVIFIFMQGICIILGCLIDQISIMMITIPLYLPIVQVMGFNPIWFWCLYLVNMTIGGITPPFGLNLFILKGTSSTTSLQEVYRAAIPFVIIMIAGMVPMVIFPQIITWIPTLFQK